MSDAETTPQPEIPDADEETPLSGAGIERILGDFRDWLTEFQNPPESTEPPDEYVDLYSLFSQFTALRHEINLQTKAARSTLEQNASTIEKLAAAVEAVKNPQPAFEEKVKPLLKGIVDAYDALALARKQVDKLRDKLATGTPPLEAELTTAPEIRTQIPSAERAGFWGRLFGGNNATTINPLTAERDALQRWRDESLAAIERRWQAAKSAADFAVQATTGLLSGYDMSMARIDRVLKQFGMEPIVAAGRFEAETMEAVEAVADSGLSAGTVIEEVRRGYLYRGTVFRCAQVRVAR